MIGLTLFISSNFHVQCCSVKETKHFNYTKNFSRWKCLNFQSILASAALFSKNHLKFIVEKPLVVNRNEFNELFLDKRNKYLVLDEPLSNLDLFHEINFMNIIKELSKRKVGIVLILHDLNITAKYSDFIAMMSEGHLKFYGSPSQVLTRNNLYEVYKLKMKVSRNPLRIFYY